MILHDNVREVDVSGEKSTSNFRIATSAKAFKILSDGIYSDKVRAIIRELSTNAYDSHIDAGKPDIPFDVHLPTSTEMYFSVRDYGTGMSKEKIENLYTTYFDSDRNTSDAFTGALGLGSKSPFSYTDSFTVESHFNGNKYIYNCYINSNGQPQVSLLFEGKTDELNGVEIKFSVYESDADEFISKASSVFYAFPIRPNLTGSRISFIEKTVIDSGDDWELISHSWTRRNGSLAIMGNVAYPIDYIPFEGQISKATKSLLNIFNIDIYFEVGELDVSASRESLSYDYITIKNIISKTEKIIKEFQAKVDKIASGSKNYWDAVSNLSEFSKKYKNITTVIPTTNFRGSSISINKEFIFRVDNNSSKIISYYKTAAGVERIQKYGEVSFSFGTMPLIIVGDEDTERKCIMKSRTYLSNNEDYDVVFIIEQKDWKNKYKKQWKNIPVKCSSKLPKPVYKRKTTAAPKYFSDVTKMNSIGNHNMIGRDDVDYDKFNFYIVEKNNKFVHISDEKEVAVDLNEYREFVKLFDFISDSKIYAVKIYEVRKKKFKENKWVNIVDFVESKLDDLIKDYSYQIQEYSNGRENLREIEVWKKIFSNENASKVLKKDSIYFKTKNIFDPISNVYGEISNKVKLDNIIRFANRHNKDVPKNTVNIDVEIEKMLEFYPLLKRLGTYELKGSPDIIEYINAMNLYKEA